MSNLSSIRPLTVISIPYGVLTKMTMGPIGSPSVTFDFSGFVNDDPAIVTLTLDTGTFTNSDPSCLSGTLSMQTDGSPLGSLDMNQFYSDTFPGVGGDYTKSSDADIIAGIMGWLSGYGGYVTATASGNTITVLRTALGSDHTLHSDSSASALSAVDTHFSGTNNANHGDGINVIGTNGDGSAFSFNVNHTLAIGDTGATVIGSFDFLSGSSGMVSSSVSGATLTLMTSIGGPSAIFTSASGYGITASGVGDGGPIGDPTGTNQVTLLAGVPGRAHLVQAAQVTVAAGDDWTDADIQIGFLDGSTFRPIRKVPLDKLINGTSADAAVEDYTYLLAPIVGAALVARTAKDGGPFNETNGSDATVGLLVATATMG